jgi:hypothetical protein
MRWTSRRGLAARGPAAHLDMHVGHGEAAAARDRLGPARPVVQVQAAAAQQLLARSSLLLLPRLPLLLALPAWQLPPVHPCPLLRLRLQHPLLRLRLLVQLPACVQVRQAARRGAGVSAEVPTDCRWACAAAGETESAPHAGRVVGEGAPRRARTSRAVW